MPNLDLEMKEKKVEYLELIYDLIFVYIIWKKQFSFTPCGKWVY